MAEEFQSGRLLVQLNDVKDLVSALRSGGLADLLKGIGSGLEKCDYDCGCNQSMCGCRGSISKAGLDEISYPEFLAMRERRLADLREQIEQLSAPKDLMK